MKTLYWDEAGSMVNGIYCFAVNACLSFGYFIINVEVVEKENFVMSDLFDVHRGFI